MDVSEKQNLARVTSCESVEGFTACSSGEGMLGMWLITELLHMWRSQNVETDGWVCAVRLSWTPSYFRLAKQNAHA